MNVDVQPTTSLSLYIKQNSLLMYHFWPVLTQTTSGIVVPDPEALKAIFLNDIEKTNYEVQSFDCHVINSSYTVGAPEGLGPDKDGKNMSIVVMVNGSVKYFAEGEDGDIRGFTDSLVLVPNWEARGPRAPKGLSKWLIQNQTFRLVL